MKVSESWIVADVRGLAKLVENRPKAFVVYELLSNALDEASARVDIQLEKLAGRPFARLVVTDDNPEGFQDLRHAFTLFAESAKKGEAEKRGRFNMGEKVVLSLCREAKIVTTTGTVEFLEDGKRREHARERTERGSRFEAVLRMRTDEFEQCLKDVGRVLLPGGVEVYLNGERLLPRTPLARFEEVLPTVLADPEGALRPTRRKARVEVYETAPGEEAMVYEMGIPVVPTGDRFHVNVLQKVPLNLDRDNVTPAFLQAVRTHVVNHTVHLLGKEDVTGTWVDQALRDERISEEAVRAVVRERYGERVVTADPSDPEAVARAVSHGYTVLAGGMLDRDQWRNVKRVEVAPSAGRLFPTPKPYGGGPGAEPVDEVPVADWTPGMRQVVALSRRLARHLMGVDIRVRIVRTKEGFGACYGGRELHFNLQRLGHAFFDRWQNDLERVLDLLLDEFGHEYESNHLSERYYRALRTLGAKMTVLALREPAVFEPVQEVEIPLV